MWNPLTMKLGSAVYGGVSKFNECVNFFQSVRSAISSVCSWWSESQEQDHVLHLERGLQRISDTLPAMYNLVDGAEWRSHEDCVAKLLPKLKDAVYDADDLLDEFRWYEMKVELEGNASKFPLDFLRTVIKDGFSKLNDVQVRLDRISSEAEKMALREVTQRFDKSVRPITSSRKLEEKIFGLDDELDRVNRFLGVTKNSKRKRARSSINASTSTSPSNQVSTESRIPSFRVIPIVGLGGHGKTTLVQHICSDKEVKSHFELIIWICVSDDFDVTRLTKEIIESCPKNKAMTSTDNLDSLQHALSSHMNNKRFLIVLDDMWEDALKENGLCWKRFCAPLGSTQKGGMILVTTRCQKVAEGVGTVDPIKLEGLKADVFWNFFKLCVFGSESSNDDPELERIGKSIVDKLKGSPLAAKTLGRMLRMDLQASHWNTILESELWQLNQEPTDILPALRLSYMYLPFYLKRCFPFCAVYPKDYKFEKADLAEIWAAEGFVEPQGDVPIQDIGCQYFEDLVTRSFFQKVSCGYIIHDLLHDMAQKVSEHECFILRNKNDFEKVPQNVRHIYVFPSIDFDNSNMLRLCRYTKLRTLICKKQSGNRTSSVMDQWCTKLLRIRVISCASTNELPDSIGNLKHLRYLKISRGFPLSIPSTFCWLYNLQILDVKTCMVESLPNDFSNLSNLQRFVSKGFSYHPGCHIKLCAADKEDFLQGVRLIKNLNQFCGHLEITNASMLSKDQAAEAELKNKKCIYQLSLAWSGQSQIMQHNAIEVLQVLQPPGSLRCLFLMEYPGVSPPSWFQPQNLPSLTSLEFRFFGFKNISVISENKDLNETPNVLVDSNNGSIDVFQSLTELTIYCCQNLSSLEHFLHPDYVPVIKKIKLEICKSLVSVPTERFGDLGFLEELDVKGCPKISSQNLVSPSLTRLSLGDCGNLLENIDCPSLEKFYLEYNGFVTSIQPQMWNLPALQELYILSCRSLASVVDPPLRLGTGSIRAFSKLNVLRINQCHELLILDGLLTPEYLPAIKAIDITYCEKLLSLRGERLENFRYLKDLFVFECPSLNWQRGLVLPSSLRYLALKHCGDFSACVPGCLENLTSLVSLRMSGCESLTSIPASIWSRNLALLELLVIEDCPNLVSIGGAKAVAKIKEVRIGGCPNLREAEEIMMRGPRRSSRKNN